MGIQTGAMCGQAMDCLASMLAAIEPNDTQLRNAAASGLKAAETLAAIANISLNGNPLLGENIRDAVDDWLGGSPPQPVINAVQEWIAPGGRLTRPPFNLNAADFTK